MEIKVNILELASELAEKKVKDTYRGRSVYVKDEEGNTTYTELAQGLFNEYYDEYYDIIRKCEAPPKANKLRKMIIERITEILSTDKYGNYDTSSEGDIRELDLYSLSKPILRKVFEYCIKTYYKQR